MGRDCQKYCTNDHPCPHATGCPDRCPHCGGNECKKKHTHSRCCCKESLTELFEKLTPGLMAKVDPEVEELEELIEPKIDLEGLNGVKITINFEDYRDN